MSNLSPADSESYKFYQLCTVADSGGSRNGAKGGGGGGVGWRGGRVRGSPLASKGVWGSAVSMFRQDNG